MFLDSVPQDVAEMIVERLESSDATMRATQLRVLGGAIARVPADATAYAHRGSRIMTNVAAFYDGPEDKAVREAWMNEFAADLRQSDTGAYANFLGDEGAERVRAAYPDARGIASPRSSAAMTRPTCSGSTKTSHLVERAQGARGSDSPSGPKGATIY
jgi:hypothetical protein